MPIVKRLQDMYEKYYTKYDGDNVRTTFAAVSSIMYARYEGAMSPIYNVVETVRDILTSNGVPTGLHGMYYAFAQIIARMTFSHKAKTLQTEISGVKNYFITAYKADPKILDAIIQAVIGTLPPY